MKIGVIFGGPSREREISFAGGRTVYDNLNKDLFEAVPIFVDSNKKYILLDWEYVYKGTIRDFYPPTKHIEESKNAFQIYVESIDSIEVEDYDKLISEVGRPLDALGLKSKIDFAFLALHGSYGEDGQVQGYLDSLNIPYSGSGIMPCSIGINKAIQKLMHNAGFETPAYKLIHASEWDKTTNKKELFNEIVESIGLPLVIKPANQGSSLGVSVLEESNSAHFNRMVEKHFYPAHKKRILV